MKTETDWLLVLGIFGTLVACLLFILIVRMDGKSAGLDLDNPCNIWVYADMPCQHRRVQECVTFKHYNTDQCIRLVVQGK